MRPLLPLCGLAFPQLRVKENLYRLSIYYEGF